MERIDDYDWENKEPSWEEEFERYVQESYRREQQQRQRLELFLKEKRKNPSWRRGF